MKILNCPNYDYSNHKIRKLSEGVQANTTDLKVDNATSLTEDDFLLLNPGKSNAEVVTVSSIVGPDLVKLSSGTIFIHYPDELVYKIPYNQIKVYGSDTESGTYTEKNTLNMIFSARITNYYDSSPSNFYKITYYDSIDDIETSIDDSKVLTIIEDFYVTEQELRCFMQLDESDSPNSEDLRTFIKIAKTKLDLDLNTSNENILFLANIMLAKFFVMRGLATKAISKGYIQIEVEGRTVTKAHQELVLEAENSLQEYKEFISNVDRREATATMAIYHSGAVDAVTLQDLVDNLHGISNANNHERTRWFKRYWRTNR